MWVVKLGGSLAHDASLHAWLSELVNCPDPVVVVPGGGPFADEVRRLQQTWLFDDGRAHALALRAMDVFAETICALHPGVSPLESLQEMPDTGRVERAVRVWIPSRDVLADSSVEQSWDVTSDSLSAWLAGRLRAHGLLLVKSKEPDTEDGSLMNLVEEGLLDRAFLRYGPQAGCPIALLHRDRSGKFDGWRSGWSGCGYRIKACN